MDFVSFGLATVPRKHVSVCVCVCVIFLAIFVDICSLLKMVLYPSVFGLAFPFQKYIQYVLT